MDKQQLIDRLKRLVDYAEAMPMDSVMENFTVKELKDWIRLLEQEQRIKPAFCHCVNRKDNWYDDDGINRCFDCEKIINP